MSTVRVILNLCAEIMRYKVDLFGIRLSIMNVLVYGILAVVAVKVWNFFN